VIIEMWVRRSFDGYSAEGAVLSSGGRGGREEPLFFPIMIEIEFVGG
jgi:hypothetical protein